MQHSVKFNDVSLPYSEDFLSVENNTKSKLNLPQVIFLFHGVSETKRAFRDLSVYTCNASQYLQQEASLCLNISRKEKPSAPQKQRIVNVIPVTMEMTGPQGALPVRISWPVHADIKTTGGGALGGSVT